MLTWTLINVLDGSESGQDVQCLMASDNKEDTKTQENGVIVSNRNVQLGAFSHVRVDVINTGTESATAFLSVYCKNTFRLTAIHYVART